MPHLKIKQLENGEGPCLQLRGSNVCQKKSSRLERVSKIKGSLPLDVVQVNIPQAHLLSQVIKVLHNVLKHSGQEHECCPADNAVPQAR